MSNDIMQPNLMQPNVNDRRVQENADHRKPEHEGLQAKQCRLSGDTESQRAMVLGRRPLFRS